MKKKKTNEYSFQQNFEFYSPGELEINSGIEGAKVIGIGAHSDDLDFMCLSAIEAGRSTNNPTFLGLVLSDGRGSTRGPAFQSMKDEDFIELRRQEQRAAAKMAGYRGVLQFSYASSEIRRSTNPKLVEDLKRVFQAGNFNTVFTHSPFDRHATHRALSVHVLRAIQELPKRIQPKRVIGCEVWRSLDWLPSKMRKSFSILSTKAQMKELFSLYQSQIAGTKNYPEAVIGRKRSNATFSDSHAVDFAEFAEIGIDLSSVAHGKVSLAKFVGELLKAFQTEIQNELKPYLEKSNGNHHRKKSGSRIKVRSKNRR